LLDLEFITKTAVEFMLFLHFESPSFKWWNDFWRRIDYNISTQAKQNKTNGK